MEHQTEMTMADSNGRLPGDPMYRFGEGPTLTFGRLQQEVHEWSLRNFGPVNLVKAHQPLLGIGEELGELATELPDDPHIVELIKTLGRLNHSYLKQEQNIRKTYEEHQLDIEDAVADMQIYLANFCSRHGIHLQSLIERTWRKVGGRDWKANPNTAHYDMHFKQEFPKTVKCSICGTEKTEEAVEFCCRY